MADTARSQGLAPRNLGHYADTEALGHRVVAELEPARGCERPDLGHKSTTETSVPALWPS